MRVIRSLVVFAVVLSACGGGDGDSGGGGGPPSNTLSPPDIVRPTPGATNTVMPVFSRPFANEYQVLNYFDHDVPTAPETTNGYQLTYRGDHAVPGKDVRGYDGHSGIDWLLPENTPLLAVANATVVFVGDRTGPCFLQDNEVTATKTVTITFTGPDGDSYSVSYLHVNRIDVAVGDAVTEGQQIALSGATGCVGKAHIAHLHFEVVRVFNRAPLQYNVIDPFGWEGPGVDPYAAMDVLKRSQWMWKPGQAPDMVPWRR